MRPINNTVLVNDCYFIIMQHNYDSDSTALIQFNKVTRDSEFYLIHNSLSQETLQEQTYSYTNNIITKLDWYYGIQLSCDEKAAIKPIVIDSSDLVTQFGSNISFDGGRTYGPSLKHIYYTKDGNERSIYFDAKFQLNRINSLKQFQQSLRDKLIKIVFISDILKNKKSEVDKFAKLIMANHNSLNIGDYYFNTFSNAIEYNNAIEQVSDKDIDGCLDLLENVENREETFIFRQKGFQVTYNYYNKNYRLFGNSINKWDTEKIRDIIKYGIAVGVDSELELRVDRHILATC